MVRSLPDLQRSVACSVSAPPVTRPAAHLKRTLAGQGFDVKTWFELDDFYAKTVDLYKTELGVLHSLSYWWCCSATFEA